MAERVVLATVELDDLPVAESQARLGRGFEVLEGGASRSARRMSSDWARTGDVLVSRMFSVRLAVTALLGSFGVGGLLLGFRSMINAMVESSSGFKTFSAASEQAQRRVAALVVEVGHVNEIFQAMAEWLDRIAFLSEKLPAQNIGKVVSFLFGQTNLGQLLKVIEASGALIDKLSGRSALGEIVKAVRVSDREFKERLDITQPLIDAGDFIESRLVPGTAAWSAMLRNAADEAQRILFVWRDISTEVERIGEEDITKPAGLLSPDTVGATAIAWQSLAIATEAAAASLTTLIAEGGSGKDLFREVLLGLSRAMFAKAAEYVAYAVAATTAIGAATLGGTPGQFLAAAAKFGAVGTIAALAARGVGGGSSGGGGAGASRGFASSQPVQRSISISVVIEGNVDSDERIRQIVDSIRTATSDNA